MMTDKQMEERIDEVIEFIRQTLLEFHEYGEDENEAKDYAEDCREEIEKLVEEVEREKNVEIIKRLKKYQLGLENYIEEYGLNRIEAIKVNEFGIKDN